MTECRIEQSYDKADATCRAFIEAWVEHESLLSVLTGEGAQRAPKYLARHELTELMPVHERDAGRVASARKALAALIRCLGEATI
jgi:hypothetical protein